MISHRRQFLFVLIIALLAFLLVYAFQIKTDHARIDKLKFSKLTFEGKMGHESICHDSTRITIIIWFHPECERCRYQLDVISRNINRFYAIRLLFLTDEKKLFENNYSNKWPGLVEASYAWFGIIEKAKFVGEFGPVLTPSMLFFNYRGILKEKLYGEVKIEKIITLIDKHFVPEQKRSGSK